MTWTRKRSSLVPGGFWQLMNPHGPLHSRGKVLVMSPQKTMIPNSLHGATEPLTSHGEAPLPLAAIGQWGRDHRGPRTGSPPCHPPSPPDWPAAVPAPGVLQGKRKSLTEPFSSESSRPPSGTYRTLPALLGHCPALRPCFYQRRHTCQRRSSWRERSSVCRHASEK